MRVGALECEKVGNWVKRLDFVRAVPTVFSSVQRKVLVLADEKESKKERS